MDSTLGHFLNGKIRRKDSIPYYDDVPNELCFHKLTDLRLRRLSVAAERLSVEVRDILERAIPRLNQDAVHNLPSYMAACPAFDRAGILAEVEP